LYSVKDQDYMFFFDGMTKRGAQQLKER